ncbi:hypothetical protein GBA52_015118 [Prunus armeniaca]|nr:hypothetical protein GBA52_015118 [Prunus armeniaca]
MRDYEKKFEVPVDKVKVNEAVGEVGIVASTKELNMTLGQCLSCLIWRLKTHRVFVELEKSVGDEKGKGHPSSASTDSDVNVNTPAIKGAKNDNATIMKATLRSGATVTPDIENLETENLTPRQRPECWTLRHSSDARVQWSAPCPWSRHSSYMVKTLSAHDPIHTQGQIMC